MLPPELENLIFEYAISLEIYNLQENLLSLIFAINGAGECLNTLLLGFCLTPHDDATYTLVCFEYCLETLENLLNGKGVILGILNSNISQQMLKVNMRDSRFCDYWNLLYYKSFNVLRSVISPLKPLLRRVYYVIKDKPLSNTMVLKIRRKMTSIFC